MPLRDRVRALSLLRALVVVGTVVAALAGHLTWSVDPGPVVGALALYWLAAAVVGWLYEHHRRRGLPVFGLLLIVDGLVLQAVTFVTGGLGSPLRYLILVQLVVVALVASHRTGLKLAIWQSLLLLTVDEAVTVGLLSATDVAVAGDGPHAFIVVMWVVTLATCTASSINERELRRRRYESEALAQMANELERAMSPMAVADVVLRSATDVLDTTRSAFVDLRDGPTLLAAAGAAPPAPAGPDRDGLLDTLDQRRRTLLVSSIDPVANPWLTALMPQAGNVVILPLTAQAELIGALVLERTTRAGSRLEQRVLAAAQRIADHASLSVANAWLHERVAQHASIDGLTGVANRRSFDDALRGALAENAPVGLLVLDLDHFKSVNDTYGHATGDVVLEAVGNVLRTTAPPGALPARYGGEEFAVVWAGGTRGEMWSLAERILHAVAAADTPVAVTASIGVTYHEGGPCEPSDLVVRADEALYKAKRGGRNRVVGTATEATRPPSAELSP